jgi:hypothetical protein
MQRLASHTRPFCCRRPRQSTNKFDLFSRPHATSRVSGKVNQNANWLTKNIEGEQAKRLQRSKLNLSADGVVIDFIFCADDFENQDQPSRRPEVPV